MRKKINEVMDIYPDTPNSDIDRQMSWGEKEFKIIPSTDKAMKIFRWYNRNDWTDGIYYVYNKEPEERIDVIMFFVEAGDLYRIYSKSYEYAEHAGSVEYEDHYGDEEPIYLSELDFADSKSFQDIIKNIFELKLDIEKNVLSKIR